MRKLMNTILAGGLALSMVAGATAAVPSAQVQVNPDADGAYNVIITAAPNFGVVDYSLTDQPNIAGSTLVIRVTDATGGAEGWNVTMSGGPFTSTTPAHTFDVSNMTLGNGSALVVGTVGTAGNISTLDGNGDPVTSTTEGSKIISASSDHGSNGVFDITFAGNKLNVPGGTLVGTYTSTLTVGLNTGP